MKEWIKRAAAEIQSEVLAASRRGNIIGWKKIEDIIEKHAAVPLTVAEAREKRVCRICEKPANGPLTLDFGAEFAHTDCLSRPIENGTT